MKYTYTPNVEVSCIKCTLIPNELQRFDLHFRTVVRLGELNLETPTDCEGGICADPPQDFSPADIILHPDFNIRTRVSDDIALIRLDRKVRMNG